MIRRSGRSRPLLAGLAAALWILLHIAAAQAQAVPTATGPGSYTDIGVAGSYFDVNYGQQKVGGGSVYLDANLYRRVGAELQYQTLRYTEPGNMRQTTYLAGPRFSFRTRNHSFVPWADLLVGRGEFRFPYGYAKGVYFVYAPGAGVDYGLTRNIKVRLISVQYQKWPQFTYGDLHPYGVSAGVSLRVW